MKILIPLSALIFLVGCSDFIGPSNRQIVQALNDYEAWKHVISVKIHKKTRVADGWRIEGELIGTRLKSHSTSSRRSQNIYITPTEWTTKFEGVFAKNRHGVWEVSHLGRRRKIIDRDKIRKEYKEMLEYKRKTAVPYMGNYEYPMEKAKKGYQYP